MQRQMGMQQQQQMQQQRVPQRSQASMDPFAIDPEHDITARPQRPVQMSAPQSMPGPAAPVAAPQPRPAPPVHKDVIGLMPTNLLVRRQQPQQAPKPKPRPQAPPQPATQSSVSSAVDAFMAELGEL